MKINIPDGATRFINEVLEKEEYSSIFKDLIVMDIGCNIGSFTLWIQPMAKKIYAIDIAYQNIETLKYIVVKKKLENVYCFNCGISGSTGIRTITEEGKPEEGGWKLGDGKNEVQTYTVLDFLKLNDIPFIDILKLDVEGGEIEILSDPTFPKDKVKTIIGEFHSTDNDTVEQLVKNLGYRYIRLPGNHFIAR